MSAPERKKVMETGLKKQLNSDTLHSIFPYDSPYKLTINYAYSIALCWFQSCLDTRFPLWSAPEQELVSEEPYLNQDLNQSSL
jgi:hypothetical protein